MREKTFAHAVFQTLILTALLVSITRAEDPAAPVEDEPPAVTITTRWTVLYTAGRSAQGTRPIPPSSPLKPLDDLKFTGPEPGHPFVLGHFAADGTWGIVNGGIQLVDGANAAIKLATAADFELEGTIDMDGYGGWFLLVGWDQGRGYSISNVNMKESGSPWFLTEYRGNTAIAEAHQEVVRYEWRREQPFRLVVDENAISLEVGRFTALDKQPLANYSTGDVIFGVYDTRYGPKPVRIRALRIRAIE